MYGKQLRRYNFCRFCMNLSNFSCGYPFSAKTDITFDKNRVTKLHLETNNYI